MVTSFVLCRALAEVRSPPASRSSSTAHILVTGPHTPRKGFPPFRLTDKGPPRQGNPARFLYPARGIMRTYYLSRIQMSMLSPEFRLADRGIYKSCQAFLLHRWTSLSRTDPERCRREEAVQGRTRCVQPRLLLQDPNDDPSIRRLSGGGSRAEPLGKTARRRIPSEGFPLAAKPPRILSASACARSALLPGTCDLRKLLVGRITQKSRIVQRGQHAILAP